MAEQKTKPATKKLAAAQTTSKVADKAKTTKVSLTGTAKLPLVKQAVAVVPRKTKTATGKKVAVPAAKKPGSRAKPEVIKSKPAAIKSKSVAVRKTAKPTAEERYRMVETAAYFIAERHGFQGRSDEHWAAAEREIAAKLGH